MNYILKCVFMPGFKKNVKRFSCRKSSRPRYFQTVLGCSYEAGNASINHILTHLCNIYIYIILKNMCIHVCIHVYMCVFAWCTVSQTVFCMFDKIISNLFFCALRSLCFSKSSNVSYIMNRPFFNIQ